MFQFSIEFSTGLVTGLLTGLSTRFYTGFSTGSFFNGVFGFHGYEKNNNTVEIPRRKTLLVNRINK